MVSDAATEQATSAYQSLVGMRRVLEVSRALAAERDLDKLLDIILNAVTDLVRADRCSLFILDREKKELWTRIAQGSGVIRLPVGSGIAGAVAEKAEVINIPDAYNDDRFNPENDKRSGYKTKSILAMPMIDHHDQVVGVLQALNKADGKAFTSDDQSVLDALCSQAAVAINTAQLISVEQEQQVLIRDMELARTIQEQLLPDAAPESDVWRIVAWQQSCDQTSGDYHDYLQVPNSDAIDCIVGDVSGHGIGAALVMSTARAFLHGLHQTGAEPADLLARLNNLLERDMRDDMFMTLVLCRLFTDGSLCYSSAGHEPPLLWRHQTQTFEELSSSGLMLGALDDSEYEQEMVAPLKKGDCLVLCTDGFFEALDPETGKDWGVEGLQDIIRVYAKAGAERIVEKVKKAIFAHMKATSAEDDLTLLVVERL